MVTTKHVFNLEKTSMKRKIPLIKIEAITISKDG